MRPEENPPADTGLSSENITRRIGSEDESGADAEALAASNLTRSTDDDSALNVGQNSLPQSPVVSGGKENPAPLDLSVQPGERMRSHDSSEIIQATLASPLELKRFDRVVSAPRIESDLENISANGGAIGALVLGIWALVGSFITNWSMVNGVIGMLLGFWGLTSRKRRMAWVGILLCVLSVFLSGVEISEIVNGYLNAVDETAP